jgi:DNA-binding LacI/PurR family transcriptional regulator
MKRPTSFDLAAMAGVSQATVSRALNGSALVSADARRRVMDAAQKLHYKVDSNARKLRSNKIQTLAVLVLEDMENDHGAINPFFVPMISEIIKYAGQKGFELVISLQQESNNWGADYCISRPAEGIIFLGSKDFETYAENFQGYNHADDNWVVWGLNRTARGKVCVVSDNEGGAFDAVAHLIRQGRRRIAYFGKFSGDHWEFIERYQGYCRALHDAGLPFDDALKVDCALTLDDGAAAAGKLLDTGVAFDAIFASTDIMGIGAMRELTRRGIAIPGQVAVMGFDDLWVCNTVSPRLSSVRQDTTTAARVLVDSVAALIEGREITTTRIPTQLVIRDSCRRV